MRNTTTVSKVAAGSERCNRPAVQPTIAQITTTMTIWVCNDMTAESNNIPTKGLLKDWYSHPKQYEHTKAVSTALIASSLWAPMSRAAPKKIAMSTCRQYQPEDCPF